MRDASDLLVNSHIILNGTLTCTIENYVISFYWCELDGNCEVLLLYLFVVDVQFFYSKEIEDDEKDLGWRGVGDAGACRFGGGGVEPLSCGD